MVFEFAIHPELVATWGELSNYRYFYEKFGIGQPRIMAEYPNLQHWRRKVLLAASRKGDMELQRITAMIALLTETTILRKTDGYDANIEWLENAEKEDSSLPFRAILAHKNPHNYSNILVAQTLDLTVDSKWNISEQLPDVPRKASHMAEAVRPLLQNCRTAIFIDPYFMAKDDWGKWQRPFSRFMQELKASRYKLSQFQIEVHSSADFKYAPSAEYFEKRCNERLKKCIPHGLSVQFRRWKQKPAGKKLHDRYIITDIGGVDFSIGLDEGLEGETQKIALLKRNSYKAVWTDYVSSHPAFSPETAFRIEG